MSAAEPVILVLNAGSSSLKFAVLAGERTLCRGVIDRIGVRGRPQHANARGADGTSLIDGDLAATDHDEALDWLVDWVPSVLGGATPGAVGHRVVHGGDSFSAPVRVTPDVVARLEALVPLAPLHQPHNLGPIKFLLARRPGLLQVACFDTAFHATMDRLERLFALPRDYYHRGVKRYGFHGLSYEFIAARLPDVDPRAAAGRTVVAHLGNGASMCALRAGRSVATTMGFTAIDGLMMGTRTGSIDPGVLLYLLQQEGMTPDQVSDLLYTKSGLLGVSGISSDMRDLLASDRPEAAEAVELFCRRIAQALGSLVAVLGGLDALVFTGGIGEHAAPVRARVCELSEWLGVRLDPAANAAHRQALHAADSAAALLVIPTDEERMIARHVVRTLGLS
jgi:acetate kinase